METFLKELGVALNYTQELLIASLVLARVMPMVVLTPFFGGKIAPPEIKMGLGVLMTIIVWPIASTSFTGSLPLAPIPYMMLMLKEAFIGFAIGFVNMHVFTVMEVAGRIIDTARGSSMSEIMEPNSGQRETPFGNMYSQILLIIFVAVGAHTIFLDAFFHSFAAIPLTAKLPELPAMTAFNDFMIKQVGQIMLAATILASPVVAATLVTDVVFGILNRVAPQLNAYFMAMPVKAVGGVILALVIMDAFFVRMQDYVVWSLESVEKTISLLSR